MKREEIEKIIREEIDNIAPGSIPDDLDPNADMREAMDLDSMDMLNLAAALHERLGVDIPEREQAKLTTWKTTLDYLEAHAVSA